METATMKALDTVKAMYDAFGKGDIPSILEHMSEHFTWQDPCDPSIVPYGGKFDGRNKMLNFFLSCRLNDIIPLRFLSAKRGKL